MIFMSIYAVKGGDRMTKIGDDDDDWRPQVQNPDQRLARPSD